jgi:uncharacterized protein
VNELESKTSAELAVITVGNMSGASVEEFAEELFQRFGIGKKGKDNGLLILFSLGDRKVRIEVGYGLEGVINDAKAGRFLDMYAVPRFKRGEYAKGIYDVAKVAATEVAKEAGVTLAVVDPAIFPAQPDVTEAIEAAKPEEFPILKDILFWTVLIFGVVSFVLLLRRTLSVYVPKALEAKKLGLKKRANIPWLIWIMLWMPMIVLSIVTATYIYILSYTLIGGISTALYFLFKKHQKKYVDQYVRSCPKCHRYMKMVGEKADNSLLTQEELAEEKARGMEYEFWRCEDCDYKERFTVKLPYGKKCPKCKLRSVTRNEKKLKSATYTKKGLRRITWYCLNPKCDYKKVKEKKIGKLRRSTYRSSSSSSSTSSWSSSSSSWSSSSSSSSSSFGGGSSGGGGSSRGW